MGPMQKGMTYNVLPFIEPSNKSFKMSFIFPGSIQLLVGPASSLRRLQIKVLSSTLATSLGSLKQAKLFGLFSSFKRMKVPLSTKRSQNCLYSSFDPSHQ